MKTMKFFFVFILAAILSGNISAQTGNLKSESLKVAGNCGMCKSRIEKAALSEGVAKASWDASTKLLTVSFDPSRTNADALAKKVAAAGHDTEKFKAEEKVYSALPGCCKYDRTNISAPSEPMDHKGHSNN
jgi:periplasmic mercuric ion binding protein